MSFLSWSRELVGLLAQGTVATAAEVKGAVDALREVLGGLATVLPIGPKAVEVMTYKAAIGYFVGHRPGAPEVQKGAMLLQDDPRGKRLFQVFLDANNELVCDAEGVPFGRQLIVVRLEPELAEAFGDHDLVIVE